MEMTTPPEIKLGPKARAGSQSVARDPRKMKPDELRALGHEPMTPLAALRLRCLDCCGGSVDEVRKCIALTCPAWPFRMGANPWRAPLSDAEKARRRNLLAQVGKIARNSSEPEKSRLADAGLPPAAISAPEDEGAAP
jgi:hypothetical protein